MKKRLFARRFARVWGAVAEGVTAAELASASEGTSVIFSGTRFGLTMGVTVLLKLPPSDPTRLGTGVGSTRRISRFATGVSGGARDDASNVAEWVAIGEQDLTGSPVRFGWFFTASPTQSLKDVSFTRRASLLLKERRSKLGLRGIEVDRSEGVAISMDDSVTLVAELLRRRRRRAAPQCLRVR